MGPSMRPLAGLLMRPLMGPFAEPLTEPLTEPSTKLLMGQVYFLPPFRARAALAVPASTGAPLSWLEISATLPAAPAVVLELRVHMSVPQLSLHIFLMLSASLPRTTLDQWFSS